MARKGKRRNEKKIPIDAFPLPNLVEEEASFSITVPMDPKVQTHSEEEEDIMKRPMNTYRQE